MSVSKSIMENIYKSASKIVFIVLTVTACVGFLMGILPVDQFMLLAIGASSFYFSNKGDSSQEYAGK
jgi:hypothetical protein